MNPVKESVLVADATQTDLATLLQLIGGLSRNHYLAQAKEACGHVLGEIEIKGGMVLSARVQGLQGQEAVYALLSLTPHEIEAFHVTEAALPREPVGHLERLLLDGVRVQDELRRDPPRLESGAQPSGWDIFDTATDQGDGPMGLSAVCPFSGHAVAPVALADEQLADEQPADAVRSWDAVEDQPPFVGAGARQVTNLTPIWVVLGVALLALFWPRKRS